MLRRDRAFVVAFEGKNEECKESNEICQLFREFVAEQDILTLSDISIRVEVFEEDKLIVILPVQIVPLSTGFMHYERCTPGVCTTDSICLEKRRWRNSASVTNGKRPSSYRAMNGAP
jgi:hypothetical protein